jgi:hypothetical protein
MNIVEVHNAHMAGDKQDYKGKNTGVVISKGTDFKSLNLGPISEWQVICDEFEVAKPTLKSLEPGQAFKFSTDDTRTYVKFKIESQDKPMVYADLDNMFNIFETKLDQDVVVLQKLLKTKVTGLN